MAGSHTVPVPRGTCDSVSHLTLVPTVESGLAERLAGRVDEHLPV
jgi:hypothetical protein